MRGHALERALAFNQKHQSIEHAVQIIKHLDAPYAVNVIAVRLKELSSFLIFGHFMRVTVCHAIDFNDEISLAAHKIRDEWANGDLS